MRNLPLYIDILRMELESRQKRNSRFSLRGFASLLEIHPSALSRILNGKQEMSVAICRQILNVLALEDEQRVRFIHSYAESKKHQVLAALSAGTVDAHMPQETMVLPLPLETYQHLIEVAPSPAWFVSIDGAVFIGNELLKQFTRTADKERHESLSFIHQDDLQKYRNAIAKTETVSLASECDVRLLSRNGESLSFKLRIAPIRDHARKLTSWLVTASTAASAQHEAKLNLR
jgi:plasmid maintenance system antidote protein VapI